jgi:membrane-associated phospholipid phosphatase
LLRFARTWAHGPRAEAAVVAFSRLGEHGLGWHALAAAGALVDRERRPLYLRGMRDVGLAFLANQAIKFTVRRRRPELPDLPPLTGTVSALSYPSAHAATSFAAARSLPLPAPAIYPVAVAMALSRLYLGVHYPSDTLAGAALGDAVAKLIP